METESVRILLVEDNPGDVVLVREALHDAGAGAVSVSAAERLQQALEMLSAEDFDVVLLDLHLPDATELSGLEKISRAVPSVPTIVLTGCTDGDLGLRALQAGAQDYVQKGQLAGKLLLRSIRYAIERKRFQDALREREAELRQAQKLEGIGQLAAGIAHEINTPMQFIGDNLCFLEDILGDLLPALQRVREQMEGAGGGPGALAPLAEVDLDFLLEEGPKALQQSLEGVERVTKIVRAMKEFSHPGNSEKAPTDLHRAIESTLTVCRNEWKYVAEVATDFDTELPMIPCFPGDLNQVLLNLIVNAAHAIGERVNADAGQRGHIRVATALRDGAAEIRVSDDGGGIPEAVRDRVFEPFFTTKEVGKGTGQGLAVAYAIVVEKHGGSIHFETAEGSGTTFVIRLPLEEAEARQPAVVE